MRKWTERNWWWLQWAALILIALVLLVFNLAISTRKGATKTEETLSTFIMFAVGLGISFYFGKKSMSDAAAAIVKPQARGAARRLRGLGLTIRTWNLMLDRHRKDAQGIAARDGGHVPLEQVELTLDTLQIQAEATMSTVVDALNDWREFDPDILNELEDEPA